MLELGVGADPLRGSLWVIWGPIALGMWLALIRTKTRSGKVLAVLLALGAAVGPAVPGTTEQLVFKQRQVGKAVAMWQERCKKAGEFIHRTVDNVDGIALLKVRTANQFDDQFQLDDPYGHDSINEEYVLNFLRGYYHQRGEPVRQGFAPRIGYRFVEAHGPSTDGRLYRYTGRFEEPWLTNKSYLKGYIRFVLDKTPINAFSARYGVTFDDISTREERERWIAGSSLKVIDLKNQMLIAERVGYMVDAAQGSRAGQRSPWLLAAQNACPDFNRNNLRPVPGPAAVAQVGQTLDFVEKVLTPSP